MKTKRIGVAVWFGMVLVLGLAWLPVTARAQGIQVVYTFNTNNGPADPRGTLVVGPDGALYGTSVEGPNGLAGMTNSGTVFKTTTGGALTVLHNFTPVQLPYATNYEGANPFPGITFGPDGNIYGAAAGGGAYGYGTVYQLLTNGYTCSPLYTFTTIATPEGSLLVAADGSMLGTALNEGLLGGAVFGVTTNGGFAGVYTFQGFATLPESMDGADPQAGLILGPDGNYYGTTSAGNGKGGNGSIYQLIPLGYTFGYSHKQLYDFSGSNAGLNPEDNLVVGPDANLYGTAENGGTNGDGTVFRISTGGAFAALYSFTGGNDGAHPWAGLLTGPDGDLYGTTLNGGAGGVGTVFQITTNGTLTTLFTFATTNGANPYAGLTLGPDGYLYGVTSGGGTNNAGVIFRLVLPGNPGWHPRMIGATPSVSGWNVAAANVPGSTNRLLASSDLTLPLWQWQVVGTNVADGNGQLQFTDTGGAGARFYRLAAP